MPSLTTLYRAIVMVVAGVIVVKAWQLVGPTNEQVKSATVRAVELASLAWDSVQPSPQAPSNPDPRLAAVPRASEPATAHVEPAPLFEPDQNEANSIDSGELAAAAVEPSETAPASADPLSPLYSRLESLGVTEPQLAPWGANGQLYRFCCRAAWADTPSFTRHFEAVAEQPVAAVEQVVAKVEDWRRSQHQGGRLQ